MAEKLTMGPLFYKKTLLMTYREKKEELCMVFVDLEKMCDRVLKEVLKWLLMRKRSKKC